MAVAVVALSAGQAQALVVNVGGQDWDVTTFKGSYNDNIGKFNVDEMPWFGTSTLAGEFATAVEGSLHYPNSGILPFLTAPRILGPFFWVADHSGILHSVRRMGGR